MSTTQKPFGEPVPLLDLKAQYASIKKDIDAAIARVVDSQHFILGPEVEALEKSIATYSGCAHAIGVTSGTDAILVALMALDVKPGDEVITSPNTFVATATCIARLGAKAVFVDIDPVSYNLDVSKLERAITKKTKAIMPVHLFGQMADMDAVMAVANKHALPVIEDAAQAIGSEWNGKRAGAWGAMGCLSFFPSKNLGAFGDAGAVVTNDDKFARTVKLLRSQGQEPKYFSKIVGGNFRIDALQAAILSAKLPHLDGWTAGRQKNAAFYRKRFTELGVDANASRPSKSQPLTLPREGKNVRHVYNQFVVRSIDRDGLKKRLAEQGIGTEIYYPQPMHLQACFASWGGMPGDFPEAEAAANESLALPVYPELSEAQLDTVVRATLAHR
ncbi:MAG: DegT/DnrJ/EryC1/StrS family aminotransferase [Archangium sp.]|nr:DegT/DnrJ/EryC1/StrS family aminotransferase [Archangium sp.]